MKATNFLLDPPALAGVWPRRKAAKHTERDSASSRSVTLVQRFDRWLWQRQVREREAYLAQSQDIFELERRMRHLECAVGGRYY
jgi:hypothetical protein